MKEYSLIFSSFPVLFTFYYWRHWLPFSFEKVTLYECALPWSSALNRDGSREEGRRSLRTRSSAERSEGWGVVGRLQESRMGISGLMTNLSGCIQRDLVTKPPPKLDFIGSPASLWICGDTRRLWILELNVLMTQHNCLNIYVVVLLNFICRYWQGITDPCIPAIGRNRRVSVCIWQIEPHIQRKWMVCPG